MNVKFLIEGSEEIGSRNLGELIRAEKVRLAADYCLNNDGTMPGPEHPAIQYALRGMARIDLEVLGLPAMSTPANTVAWSTTRPRLCAS